jgi:hypothetical protein
VVEVGRIGRELGLREREREDLVDVVEVGRVAREGEVCERDEESSDILNREIWSSLFHTSKIPHEHDAFSRAAEKSALTLIKLTT